MANGLFCYPKGMMWHVDLMFFFVCVRFVSVCVQFACVCVCVLHILGVVVSRLVAVII